MKVLGCHALRRHVSSSHLLFFFLNITLIIESSVPLTLKHNLLTEMDMGFHPKYGCVFTNFGYHFTLKLMGHYV